MTLHEQIEAAREKLDSADEHDDERRSIGDLIIAMSHLADVVEELVKRDPWSRPPNFSAPPNSGLQPLL